MSKLLGSAAIVAGALLLASVAGATLTTHAARMDVHVLASSALGQVRKCRGVTVRLGGKRVCVAPGRPCQSKYEATYERLGFVCSGGFLYRRIVIPNARIVAAIPVGGGPNAIRYLDGSIWVLNFADGTLSRINPATNSVIATIKVGTGYGDITYGDGSIWEVSEEQSFVLRIDPAANSVVAKIPTQGIRPMGLAWTPGAIWVGNHGHDAGKKATVARIDTSTNQVVWQTGVGNATYDAVGGPSWVKTAFGAVWFSVPNANELDRIDPGHDGVTQAVAPIDCVGDAEPLDGSVWLSDCSNGFYRLDPATNAIVGHVSGPAGGRDDGPLTDDGTYLWATTDTGLLTRVDPRVGKVTATWRQPARGLFDGPAALAFGDGSIWLADSPGNRVLRVQP